MNGQIRVIISTLTAATEFELPSQAESIGYLLVGGSGMLWEQGVSQFELWTGQTDSIILDT